MGQLFGLALVSPCKSLKDCRWNSEDPWLPLSHCTGRAPHRGPSLCTKHTWQAQYPYPLGEEPSRSLLLHLHHTGKGLPRNLFVKLLRKAQQHTNPTLLWYPTSAGPDGQLRTSCHKSFNSDSGGGTHKRTTAKFRPHPVPHKVIRVATITQPQNSIGAHSISSVRRQQLRHRHQAIGWGSSHIKEDPPLNSRALSVLRSFNKKVPVQ